MTRGTPTCSRIAAGILLAVPLCLLNAQVKVPPTAAESMRLAEKYLAQGKPELAVSELRKVVQLDPENVNAHANLGVLLFFQAKYAEAIPQLRAALTAQPALSKIQALLGMSERRTGELKVAQHDLDAAFPQLQESKIRREAGLELIEVDQSLGLLDKAAATVGALRAENPEDPQVLAAAYQIYSLAMNDSLLSLAVAAPDSAELHFIMGQRLVAAGKNEEALAQFRQALAKNPDLPGLHFELANFYVNSSDPALHAQATTQFKAALKVNPTDEKALSGLALVEADNGSLAAAAADFHKALALQPNDAEAETGLAKVLVAMNQKEQATALLEDAVKLDPTDIVAHYRLSTLYRQQGRTADAKRQLAEYEHYKNLKAQLQTAFNKMRTAPDSTAPPSQ